METKPKNRAWVKDAAIVFLVVLLILTFFSNTIMNHSLPEVATQMVTDGTITAKVRGTGKVTALGDHKVKATANQTIGKVVVKAGQEVNAGDILFVLGAGDSTELEEAMNTLEDLQTQYAQAALSVPLADAHVDEKNAVTKAQDALTAAQEATKKAKAAYENASGGTSSAAANSKEVQELLSKKTELENKISAVNSSLTTQQSILNDASVKGEDLTNAYNNFLSIYQEWVNRNTSTPSPSPSANADSGQDSQATETTKSIVGVFTEVLLRPFATVGNYSSNGYECPYDLTGADASVTQAWDAYSSLKAQYDARYETAQNELVPALTFNGETLVSEAKRTAFIANLQTKLIGLKTDLAVIESALSSKGVNLTDLDAKKQAYEAAVQAEKDAQYDLESKTAAYYNALTTQERSIASANVGLSAIGNQIARQQEKIKKLSGEGDDNTITANVSGTVTEVNVTAGDTVLKDDILCAIEVPDMGYTVSFSVTNDQAQRLKIGDTATISNYYWGNSIEATLATIQTDKKNPMTNKTLTFNLEGDVTSGSELTISVGEKSARYDIIIPNSAIRTDSNGSFVLAVTEKSSPLGNRYIAKRVSIETLAQDDTNAAVTADLSYGDYVITTSSAPVASGDMVRMADSET